MNDIVKKEKKLPQPKWPDGVTKDGRPKPQLQNTKEAMRALGVDVSQNDFTGKKLINGRDFSDEEVSDDMVAVIMDEISKRFGFTPTENTITNAIRVMARVNHFNPVADWLDSLVWDKEPRVELLFSEYLGASNTTLNRAFARKMMCAMARRAKQPGTKFDHMVILEGRQGAGKTRFATDLAVRPEYFTDAPVLHRDSKTQMEIIEGKWVVEIAELAGMRRAEIENIKSFITREADRERKAYTRFRVEKFRTCIFVGTTNDDSYLRDVTGNRRFWPIKIDEYDREAFLNDREQLFAEAVVLEPNENLWLDNDELQEMAAKAQEKRMEPNPYAEALADISGTAVQKEERIHSDTVWRHLGIAMEGRLQKAKVVADAMKLNGWKRARVRVGGKSAHGYVRPFVTQSLPKKRDDG